MTASPALWADQELTGSAATITPAGRRTTQPRSRIEVSAPATHRIPVYLRAGRLEIFVAGDEPTWLYPVLGAIRQYSSFDLGWDSYGGRPLSDLAAVTGIQVLATVMNRNTPTPAVVPGSDGGVQFEWHVAGGDLEITVAGDGSVGARFDGRTPTDVWERDRIEGELALLATAIASL